jgi:hypothetical protein
VEPLQKKLKDQQDADKDQTIAASKTIATKLNNAEYASLVQLREDVARVGRKWIASIQFKESDDPTVPARPTIDDLKRINHIRSVEAKIRQVVEQEIQYAALREGRKSSTTGTERLVGDGSVSNGTSAILTLFGNAPTPRQLFSSAQITASDNAIKSELPVEELNLPPGISATKVLSGPVEETKKRTFGEAFAPPLALTTLPLPKALKRPAARDNTIVWEFKDPVQRNKKGGYTVQSLSTSTWLSYGSEGAGVDAKSPRERRKQRDRALSGGEAISTATSNAALLEALAKEEKALFARAYSSFAPSCDNSKALVAEETKDMVWWQNVGNQRYSNSAFALDPALEGVFIESGSEETGEVLTIEQQPEAFTRIIEELEEYEQDLSNATPLKSRTDVDQVLGEISELISTLASHRRIRSAIIPTPSSLPRAPIISPSPAVAAATKPDVPSESEIETYLRLQRELSYLILKLPPYIVAKIDGDQLAELGISGVIPFETRDIRGTMEEDQVFRQAKLAAMSAATNGTTASTRPSSSTSQHYSTTAQHTPAIGQAANTRYGQQVHSRTPSAAAPQYARTPSGGNQSYSTPTNARRLPGWQQPQQPSTGQNPSGPVRPGAGITNPNYANGQIQQPSYYQQRATHQTTPANYGGGYKSYQQQVPTPQQQQQQHPRANNYPPQAQQQQYNPRAAPVPPGTTMVNPVAASANYSASPAPPAMYNTPNTASTGPSTNQHPSYVVPQSQQQQQQQQMPPRNPASTTGTTPTPSAATTAGTPMTNPPHPGYPQQQQQQQQQQPANGFQQQQAQAQQPPSSSTIPASAATAPIPTANGPTPPAPTQPTAASPAEATQSGGAPAPASAPQAS